MPLPESERARIFRKDIDANALATAIPRDVFAKVQEKLPMTAALEAGSNGKGVDDHEGSIFMMPLRRRPLWRLLTIQNSDAANTFSFE